MSNVNRLCVANLAEDITATALRQRFEKVAPVLDVELAIDRASGRMRGFAYVTMASSSGRSAALAELDGVTFEERQLRVSDASNGERPEGGRGRKNDAPPRAKITQQFRERTNMAYELDCAGMKMSFKMFPTNDDTGKDDWRVECFSKATPERVIKASAPTRKQAFSLVEREWGAGSGLDWRAIEEALGTVRAL